MGLRELCLDAGGPSLIYESSPVELARFPTTRLGMDWTLHQHAPAVQ